MLKKYHIKIVYIYDFKFLFFLKYLTIIKIMELFKKGQKITLFFQKDANMVEMTCGIERVYDDRLELSLPQYFMRYIEFLQVGKQLTSKVFSMLGTIDFNSVVITSPLEEIFSIEMDYNSIKLLPGDTLPVIKAIEPIVINISGERINLKTFEISSNYVKFTSNKKLNINDELECAIFLPKNYGIIEFKAIVSEVDPIYETEYTAEYITISEQAKQDLLYYMYMYTKDID